MHLALRAPDLISAIISVDNSPNKTKLSEKFPAYIKYMQEIENAGVTKQSEADEILRRVEPVFFFFFHLLPLQFYACTLANT